MKLCEPVNNFLHCDALAWIESYARCELSLEDLCGKMQNALGSDFVHNPRMRLVALNQMCPVPAVRIEPQHIGILLTKRRRAEITERQMVDWATMVMMNDVYYWEPEDAECVCGWLNFLSLDFSPEDYRRHDHR